MGSTPERNAAEVSRGVKWLRRFHAAGVRSLTEYPGRMKYGQMDAHAGRFGLGPEVLRKARAFAGAYGGKDLDRLCDLCERHGFALGEGHVFRLLAVAPTDRAALEREAIRSRWSKGTLDVEIWKRYGNRRPDAGRRRRPPRSAEEACYQLLQACDQWGRLHRELTEPRLAAGARNAAAPLKELPRDVQQAVRRVEEAMGALQRAAARALPRT